MTEPDSEMNHSVILPHLIRCRGEAKSDRQKSEGRGTPLNPVKPSGANDMELFFFFESFKNQDNTVYQIYLLHKSLS